MLKKLLCLLGFHKWERIPYTCTEKERCEWFNDSGPIVCSICQFNKRKCKRCGRIK